MYAAAFSGKGGGGGSGHSAQRFGSEYGTQSVQDRAAQGRSGHLEGEDDDLAVLGALEARLAVGLQAGEGRERHLCLAGILRRGGQRASARRAAGANRRRARRRAPHV